MLAQTHYEHLQWKEKKLILKEKKKINLIGEGNKDIESYTRRSLPVKQQQKKEKKN